METISIKKNVLVIEKYYYNYLQKKYHKKKILNKIKKDIEKLKNII